MKRTLLIALAWIATIASPAIASTFEIHLEACCEEILVYQGLGITLRARNVSDVALLDSNRRFHAGTNGKMEKPPVFDGSYFPQLIIRRPDGSVIRTSRISSAQPEGLREGGHPRLEPGEQRSWELLVGVALDASPEPEIIFSQPGRYEITALFHTTDGVDESNTITVTVVNPTGEADTEALDAIQRMPLEGLQTMYVPWHEMTLYDLPAQYAAVFRTVLAEQPDSVYAAYAELALLQHRNSVLTREYISLTPEGRRRSSHAVFDELSQIRERSAAMRSLQRVPELSQPAARLGDHVDDTIRSLQGLAKSDG